ncbi:GNAT family N-acetyltransferase [Lapidilactobacillus bayanensis]|uniref:GNAT family N-acetyltransferase n=1 Tax=Lapidilactobacillus bayanensis TaxID=2485998 RepID=UPI000F7B1B25|nr:GNAT family N-acetyltransferase [Lapidilactobacillus bayanensis]
MIKTNRLILRKFRNDRTDMNSLLTILSDEAANKFLPWFPLTTLADVKQFYEERILPMYQDHPANQNYYWAICIEGHDFPVGLINVAGNEAHDLGFVLRKEFWNLGIVAEAAEGILDFLKSEGMSYVTATHDARNLRSGKVMIKLGMTYQYSYHEQWQPKDIPVIFKMYQINLAEPEAPAYQGYWEEHSEHFI